MLRAILDQTVERIGRDLRDQPEVEADLRDTIGRVLLDLGQFEEGEAMLRRALESRRAVLGDDHAETARSVSIWAGAFNSVFHSRPTSPVHGKLPEIERMLRRALATQKRLGSESSLDAADTLEQLTFALSNLGDVTGRSEPKEEAIQCIREALAIRKRHLGDENLVVANSLRNVGHTLARAGRPAEGEPYYRQALDLQRKLLGSENPDVAHTMRLRSWCLVQLGRTAEAAQSYREALAQYRRFLGNHNDDVASVLTELIFLVGTEARTEEVTAWENELVSLRTKRGPKSVAWATEVVTLGAVLIDGGRPEEAEDLFSKALEGRTNSQTTAMLLRNRGHLRARHMRWAAAVTDLAQSVELEPDNHESYHLLAPVLVQAGDLEGFRQLRAEVLTRFASTKQPQVAERMAKDCSILPLTAPELETVARMAETAVNAGIHHPFFTYFQHAKAMAEYRLGHFADAVDGANKVLAHAGHDVLRDVQSSAVLAMAYHQLHQTDQSRAALASAREIAEAKLAKPKSGDIGSSWNDWIIAHALLREAEALIEPQTE